MLIATDTFRHVALAEARAAGIADLRLVVLEHKRLRGEDAETSARQVLDEGLALLVGAEAPAVPGRA